MVSSKHGQQYQCSLPEIGPEVKEKETKRAFTTKEVSELLNALENKCLHYVSTCIFLCKNNYKKIMQTNLSEEKTALLNYILFF